MLSHTIVLPHNLCAVLSGIRNTVLLLTCLPLYAFTVCVCVCSAICQTEKDFIKSRLIASFREPSTLVQHFSHLPLKTCLEDIFADCL